MTLGLSIVIWGHLWFFVPFCATYCISQCYCHAPQQFGCRMFHNSEETVGNYSSEETDKAKCPTCAPLLKKDMSVGVGFDAEDLNRYSPRDRVVPWFMLSKRWEFCMLWDAMQHCNASGWNLCIICNAEVVYYLIMLIGWLFWNISDPHCQCELVKKDPMRRLVDCVWQLWSMYLLFVDCVQNRLLLSNFTWTFQESQ